MQKYDVAVIGAGVGGLSIAALLSRSGKKILVTDPSDRSGGAVAPFEKDGFRFSDGPNAVYGLEQGGPLRVLCSALGIEGTSALPPARYQVVLPDRRITVAPSRQETLDELRREFPREIDRLVALHLDAEKIALRCASSRISAYLAGRRSAGAYLRTYAFSPELSSFFSVRAQHFFGRDLDSLPLRSLVRMLGTPPVEFPGGYARLAGDLASRISDRSGTVLWREPWPELISKGRRVSGIRTSQGTMAPGTIVINSCERPPERSIFLGVREEVIPVRMENIVLCLADYRYPQNYHSLAIAPRGMNAPAGMRAVTATAPAGDDAATDRGALRANVQAVVPFLQDFIITEAHPSETERCFALPDQGTVRRGGPHRREPFPARTGLKNVLLMLDSSRALYPAIEGALRTAPRLA